MARRVECQAAGQAAAGIQPVADAVGVWRAEPGELVIVRGDGFLRLQQTKSPTHVTVNQLRLHLPRVKAGGRQLFNFAWTWRGHGTGTIVLPPPEVGRDLHGVVHRPVRLLRLGEHAVGEEWKRSRSSHAASELFVATSSSRIFNICATQMRAPRGIRGSVGTDDLRAASRAPKSGRGGRGVPDGISDKEARTPRRGERAGRSL